MTEVKETPRTVYPLTTASRPLKKRTSSAGCNLLFDLQQLLPLSKMQLGLGQGLKELQFSGSFSSGHHLSSKSSWTVPRGSVGETTQRFLPKYNSTEAAFAFQSFGFCPAGLAELPPCFPRAGRPVFPRQCAGGTARGQPPGPGALPAGPRPRPPAGLPARPRRGCGGERGEPGSGLPPLPVSRRAGAGGGPHGRAARCLFRLGIVKCKPRSYWRQHSPLPFLEADQSMMPEVRDLSDALPDLPMDPITGVGVVASRNRAPTGYDVVAQTADGLDADLWKDGLFKSKVTRYLCFTRSFSKENSHLGNVLVDMKLIDIKDTLPVGFIPIQETVDTQEVAFRKKRLCIKFIPRDSTEAAICDIRILSRSKQAPPQYTFIGELNNMGIWYRMGRVPRNHESSQPATPAQVPSSTPAPNLPRHISLTLPASFRGKSHSTRLDLEHQHSNLYAISAMDGVPFMISEKFACAPEGMQPVDLLGITIKTLAEIEKEYDYSFRTEQSAAARLPPSPTRCPPVPPS
ncbi:multivesicular body subunit 12B isoform X4 [Cygnus olor]|uniref:multivesicular body subunit 12B isoform X4 n=1 Tax=Cygnus olor TaxID=8869 RepID=UPI001ADDEFB3|nr:multivesicular body subunit 12B isoform X4 [Cygnus olor]